jgi:nucleoside-diphosphate-sugar epimerase
MNLQHNNVILVTGGRGFLGRALVKLLRRKEYRVISIDWTPATAEKDSFLTELCGDIGDSIHMENLFQREQIHGIVHLAAILPTEARRNPGKATFVNIHGSHMLLDLARKSGVRRFVFGSSLSVYGTCPEDQVVSEKDRTAPEDLYGSAKVYVEQLGEAYQQAYGVEFVGLRIGRVVGPGSRSETSAWRSGIFELLRSDQPVQIDLPYAESERILVVHVEDVAQMLYALLSSPRPAHRLYNAVCESVVVGDLQREIERLNSCVRVKLGGEAVTGNPRRVDCSRFADEFDFRIASIFEQMAAVAGGDAR